MRLILIPAIAALALMAASGSYADAATEESSIKVEGSVRTYIIRREPAQNGEAGHTEIVPLMRMRISGSPSEDVMAEAAYEASPILRDRALPVSRAETSTGFSYRAYDIEEALYPDKAYQDERFAVIQNLDRAAVHLKFQRADLHIGRQAIAFGSARAINPTDVIAPYAYTALAKEERVGVDAIRLNTPLGTLSEIDIAAVFGKHMSQNQSAAFGRIKVNALSTDISAIAMAYGRNRMAGLDMARSIGGASAWLEASHTWPSDEYADDSEYTRASAGADYAFTESIYAYAEYHKNQAGTDDPDRYLINTAKAAYAEGAVYLLGRDYLAAGITWEATPLISLSGRALVNLDDSSALLSPGAQYSASDNMLLGAGGHFGLGKGPGPFGPGTEFGAYYDVYYAFMKWYF